MSFGEWCPVLRSDRPGASLGTSRCNLRGASSSSSRGAVRSTRIRTVIDELSKGRILATRALAILVAGFLFLTASPPAFAQVQAAHMQDAGRSTPTVQSQPAARDDEDQPAPVREPHVIHAVPSQVVADDGRKIDVTKLPVLAVAVARDGRLAAAGGFDGTVRVWNLPGGDVAWRFAQWEAVRVVAFSPDGRLLAAGNVLWNLKTGAVHKKLAGTQGSVNSLTFTPDGRRLVACAFESRSEKEPTSTLAVWDVETGNLRETLSASDSWMDYSVACSPDGALVAAAVNPEMRSGRDAARRQGEVQLWETATWQLARTFRREKGVAINVAFSSDSNLLASGGGTQPGPGPEFTGDVMIWDVKSGERVQTLLRPEKRGFVSVSFSPDGRRLAGQSRWGNATDPTPERSVVSDITLWELRTGRELWSAELPLCVEVLAPRFTPDGRHLLTCDHHAVRLLNAIRGSTEMVLMKVGD